VASWIFLGDGNGTGKNEVARGDTVMGERLERVEDGLFGERVAACVVFTGAVGFNV
jgi:hypothetical protein